MKFSIVITTYNRLALLRRAVDSALHQTLPCEIVIADDASVDETQEYAKGLANQVVYHRHSSNQGHSATVNTGVRLATGDWIKLMDDDDYLAPDCIEKMAEAIARFTSGRESSSPLVLVSCQAYQVSLQGEYVHPPKKATGEVFSVEQEDIHYGMLLDIIRFGTPVQVAFQREAFLRSGGWDSQFDGNYDDINSWLKIVSYGDALFIDQYLAYRTLWSGACHKQLSLGQRWQMNVVIKQQIYPLVAAKYQGILPALKTVEDYLRLHWFLVGLKERKLLESLKLLGSAAISWRAWILLCQIFYARKARSRLFSLVE